MLNVTDEDLQKFLLFSNQWDIVRADAAGQPYIEELILTNLSTASQDALVLHHVTWWNTEILTPFLVCFGLISNILCATVLLTSHSFKRVSPSHYIAARMCIDAGFLLTLFLVWLAQFENIHPQMYAVYGWCQFVSYGSHLTQFLATWVMAVLLIDRAIFVLKPERRKSTCSVLRARAAIIGLLIVAMVVYLNISLTEGVLITKNKFMCSPLPDFMQAMRILAKLDAIINVLIPFGIMITILFFLRSHFKTQESSDVEDCPIIIDMQMIHVSVIMVVWFILLTIPSHLMRIYSLIHGVVKPTGQVSVTFLIAQQVLRIPAYISCISSPLIIVIVDKTFRSHLFFCGNTFKRRLTKGNQASSADIPMTNV